jgi:single-strand DNA-binding protein
MSNVNKVIILGRLGKDPETNNGVTKFSVATSEKWTDKSGEKKEKTEWHNIATFGKLAEICSKYLSKGRIVYVEGKLSTSKYEKNGQTMYSTAIIAETVQFIGGSTDSESNESNDSIPF